MHASHMTHLYAIKCIFRLNKYVDELSAIRLVAQTNISHAHHGI